MSKIRLKWLAISLLCFLLVPLAALPAGAVGEATAVRSINSDTVKAGGTVQVSITIAPGTATLHGFVLDEDPPAGWTVTSVQNAGGIYRASDVSWLWIEDLLESKTVIYKLTVPAAVTEGDYTISGVLKSHGISDIPVTGEDTIHVTVNHPPAAPTDPSPVDEATNVSRAPELNVLVIDPDGDAMTVTFYNAADDSVIGIVTEVASGSRARVTWSGLAPATTYNWYAKAYDGALYSQESAHWSFTTEVAVLAPDISVSPRSLAFGDVALGASSTKTVTVSNEGAADLTITMAIEGTNVDQFSVGTYPTTIAPGDSASVSVTFSPTSTGAKSATLSITSNDPDSDELTVSVSLSGNGIAPNISVSPTSKDFGDVTVGSSTSAHTFTVSNVGSADLEVGTITLTGTNFAIQNDNVSGKTIAPNSLVTFEVVFSPTSTGAKSATLTIPSNDPDEASVNVSLSGNGVGGGNRIVVLALSLASTAVIIAIASAIIAWRRRKA